jgi:predicted GNAT superfamily acetyltransferase
MRDDLNAGLASDRFQVDWWVNSVRVERKLGKKPCPKLGWEHYAGASAQSLYQISSKPALCLRHPSHFSAPQAAILLAEIPSNFVRLKAQDFSLALSWRNFSRDVFQTCFAQGYLVTDFVYESARPSPRSFYVLRHGQSAWAD